ncbi:MAG: helix-hairpin-helix domain-containing protein [Phycisphaerales bacterium]|nr:helix-hairpin-helix domain-containing protein [Phycisphaerales bacterium]
MGQARSNTRDDWARRPSAMFAAGVLGLASLSMMGVALSRELVRAPAPAPQAITSSENDEPASQPPQRASAIRLIDVNAGTLSELDLLPGIGPALGQRIIDYRSEHGPFSTPEDLTKVSGIGPRTLEKMRPLITLGEASGYTTDN